MKRPVHQNGLSSRINQNFLHSVFIKIEVWYYSSASVVASLFTDSCLLSQPRNPQLCHLHNLRFDQVMCLGQQCDKNNMGFKI